MVRAFQGGERKTKVLGQLFYAPLGGHYLPAGLNFEPPNESTNYTRSEGERRRSCAQQWAKETKSLLYVVITGKTVAFTVPRIARLLNVIKHWGVDRGGGGGGRGPFLTKLG